MNTILWLGQNGVLDESRGEGEGDVDGENDGDGDGDNKGELEFTGALPCSP